MIRTEGNMKNYVGKIRKELQLALAAIDALDRIEAPKVAGYPPVEEKKAETPAVETEETAATAETAEPAETAEAPEEVVAPAEDAPAPEEAEEQKE